MWRRFFSKFLSRSLPAETCHGAGATAEAGSTAIGASAATLARQQQQQQPWAWVPRAGLARMRHPSAAEHVPPVAAVRAPRRGAKQRSRTRAVLSGTGKAAGLALVAVPAAGLAALIASGGGEADAWEMIGSLPRTARAVWWGLRASYQYKTLALRQARKPSPSPEEAQRELTWQHQRAAQDLLLACQANGGLYIKAGQLAVSLNAVPQEYRSTLEVLQDRVPPRPFADICLALTRELGAPPDALFAAFQEDATAAASLAQVHQAVLHTGEEVAVKVQYPGLESAVAADLASMLALSRAAHWLFPETSWTWLFEELQRQLQYELDFRNEARNATRLKQLMAARRDVAVPRIVPELSGPRVLTMEWVQGCRVTDVESLQAQGLEPREVGLLLLSAFAEQTYVHGFTHADPHAGNLVVRPRPDPPPLLSQLLLGSRPRPQLVLLDHGLYVSMPDDMRRQYCQLWCALVLGDMPTAALAAEALGGPTAGRVLPEVLRPRDWRKVSPEERKRVRSQAGVGSMADLSQVLGAAPRPLLDSLRLSAVVRHSAALLGATLSDRLRINATYALKGMSLSQQEGGQVVFLGALSSRLRRWQLAARIYAMRWLFWVASAMHSVAACALPVLE